MCRTLTVPLTSFHRRIPRRSTRTETNGWRRVRPRERLDRPNFALCDTSAALDWLDATYPAGVHVRPEGGGNAALFIWTFQTKPVEPVFPPPFAEHGAEHYGEVSLVRDSEGPADHDPSTARQICLRALAQIIPGFRPYFNGNPLRKFFVDGGRIRRFRLPSQLFRRILLQDTRQSPYRRSNRAAGSAGVRSALRLRHHDKVLPHAVQFVPTRARSQAVGELAALHIAGLPLPAYNHAFLPRCNADCARHCWPWIHFSLFAAASVAPPTVNLSPKAGQQRGSCSHRGL